MKQMLREMLIIPLKNTIKLLFQNRKYKSGYFKTLVPEYFLEKEGLQISKNIKFNNYMEIGDFCFIGENTHIDNCSKIGKFSCISHNVKIGVVNHALNHISTNPFFYKKEKGWIKETTFYERKKENAVIIEPDVLISTSVVIVEGVKIGIGAVIAAGSVVTKDVPPYAVVAGVPAKIIKYRFDEILRNELTKSSWWEMSKKELLEYSKYFNNPKLFLTEIQRHR